MKKISLILTVCVFVFGATQSQAAEYKVNTEKVDAIFNAAEQQEISSVMQLDLADFSGMQGSEEKLSRKDPITALLLCSFVGYFGVHRMYLGTETLTWIGYIVTGGGCGIIVTIDWVVLLMGAIDDDISKYVNNPKFFMW
ncbi:MAG: TM2 domain-containing protein [Bacteroidales bacterium]